MNKKFFALLLALVMSLSLVACGGGDDAASDTTEDTQTEDTQTEDTGAEEFDPSAITITWASPIINHPVLRTCAARMQSAHQDLYNQFCQLL